MKNPLLTLAACASLAATATVHAETFGTFSPGDTFKLVVVDRDSIRTRGSDVKEDARVPDSVPNFSKGEIVKFRIGANGQLKGPGFSIEFVERRDDDNFYGEEADDEDADTAKVEKPRYRRPTNATLTFFRFHFDGWTPVSNWVQYKLERVNAQTAADE